MATPEIDSQSGKWCLEEIAARFVQVLESMTEQKHSARCDQGREALPGPLSWWHYVLTGGIESSIWIGASEGCWGALGGQVLSAAGVESDAETAKTTFSELATQAFSAVEQSITKRAGRRCSFESPQIADAPETDGLAATLVIVDADATEHAFAVVIASSLISALPQEPPRERAPERPRPPESGVASVRTEPPTVSPPATFDLLMDVELPVSVSFGRAQLQIKDVMKLASGSIIELNRHVAEPVEIVVNNCVIARGEVVVVEGNYGVRIDEIISAQERLRTLK